MRTTIVAAAKTNLCAPVWLTMLLILAAIVVTAAPAAGPLRVHPNNPRYFTDGSRAPDGALKAVYLTGSHHWNNFQDSAKLGQPLTNRFDYDGYLRFLEKFHHRRRLPERSARRG